MEWLEGRKLEAEVRAFERMHPRLVEAYLGQFVAVHEGRVVDADGDFEALFLRLQRRLGGVVVLIRRVEGEAGVELRAPGVRLDRGGE